MVKPYHFNIENVTNEHKDAVLLGFNDNLLTANYGSGTGVSVLPANNGVIYMELLTQSGSLPSRTEIFRFITNSWDKMPKELNYKRQDVNGFLEDKDISLVTNKWGIEQVPNKAINDIRISKIIDGSSCFKIKMRPKSQVELIIIEK